MSKVSFSAAIFAPIILLNVFLLFSSSCAAAARTEKIDSNGKDSMYARNV